MAVTSYLFQPYKTSAAHLITGSSLNTNFGSPQVNRQVGITATASGTQATAYQLTAVNNQVDTVATAADAVALPNTALMSYCVVFNNGANAMQVFGNNAEAATINGVATATGISQAAGTVATYSVMGAGKWVSDIATPAEFSTIVLNGATSGTTTVKASAIAGTTTQTFAPVTGTVASTSGTNLYIPDVKISAAETDSITTVLANVTGLTGQTLVAGATYRFRCVLPGTADGTSGISYAFNYTTATLTSIEATGISYTASAVAVQHTTTTTTQTLIVDRAAAVIMAIIEGTMVVNAGGTVALQIATHTGTTTCSCYAGASMEFVRIV